MNVHATRKISSNVSRNAPGPIGATSTTGPIVSPGMSADPSTHKQATDPTDSYQKILDYHVVEILLTTVVFGVVILLRLHH
jgi:hypothetical protein